jgi:gamma-glutamyltranspeptidase/glutathione hydrolase
MNAARRSLALLLALLFGAAAAPAQLTNGFVASAHPLATRAGLEALRAGGNAVDAAVAVGLTLGVVDGHNSGIGGGCFMLIRRATGELIALDGRETAPAAATRDMFLRDGKADVQLSQTGPLASGIPGSVAVYEHAVKAFGRRSLADALQPGISIAEHGFPISRLYASRLRDCAADLSTFPGSRAVLFRDGRPLQQGEVLRQPDLAATYRALAEQGSGWFYRGPFAETVARWMREHGGLLTTADFARYEWKVREPIRTRYRGFEIVSFPPPSSGGVHVAQMLNILEHFNLRAVDEVTRRHLLAEAMKLAFADRAHWLGDPDFVKVPRGLVSTEYAAALAARIHPERAISVAAHGTPPFAGEDVFGDRHTTHFSVADAEGNWVACTATVNTGFGSKVIVPGTGVILNNQMDDFSVQPGVPNFFGLIGAEANAIASGKRPLSSMSPTIVLKDGQPVVAIGGAGGPRIITAVLQCLVGLLDLDQSPAEALAAPRLHQQWSPNELLVEKTLPPGLREALTARGHLIREVTGGSSVHVVTRFSDSPGFSGAADPRGDGTAEGW